METKETIDYAIGKLGEIGGKLSPYAKEGWEILVRQQIIMGLIPWMTFLFCSCVLYFSQKGLKKQMKNEDDSIDQNPVWLIFTILFGVGTIVSFLCGTIEGLPHLLNPEYYAIKELLPK